MKSNNTFNLNRFALLLKQDWYINCKKYGALVLVFGGLFFLFNGFIYLDESEKSYSILDNDEVSKIFKILSPLLFLAIMIVAASNFTTFANKITASNYLLTPASALEKLLASFFIRVVVMTSLVIGFFVLMIDINLSLLLNGKIGCTTYFDASLMPQYQLQYLVLANHPCPLWNWLVLLNLYAVATIFSSLVFIGKIKNNTPQNTQTMIIRFFSLFLGLAIVVGFLKSTFYKEFNYLDILPKPYAINAHFDSNAVFCLSILPLAALNTFLMAYYSLKEKEVE